MNHPLILIPKNQLAFMVGKLAHVEGWGNGCVFRIMALVRDEKTHQLMAEIETPKSHKKKRVHSSRLCYTRSDEPQAAEGRPQ